MKKARKEYINLLPRDEKKRSFALSARFFPVWLFALAWLLLFASQIYKAWELQRRTSSVEADRLAREQELEALQKTLGITPAAPMNSEKAALIDSLLSERVLWSEVFRQFSRIVPKGLWFDNLEGNAGERREIRIRGGAFTYLSVAEFMLAMEKTDYLENPQLSYARKTVVQGQDVVAFEIVCGIKKNGRGRDDR